MNEKVMWYEYRIAQRKDTGEIVRQRREITRTYTNPIWWKPWIFEGTNTYGEWQTKPLPQI